MRSVLMTLCIIHQHPKVLLGMKKRGFGRGRWNGFGGKVMKGEAIEEAARREVCEEAGIVVGDIERVGVIDFAWEGKPEALEVHIFRSTDFSGKLKESGEMKPQWFHVSEIPFDEMWSDDPYWLPLLIKGKKFTARFLFGPGDKVLEHEVREATTL